MDNGMELRVKVIVLSALILKLTLIRLILLYWRIVPKGH